MPAISRIRFTNVIYENGGKRYNNEIFHFDGHSGAIILENGGGKTVFIQTALQAVIPHMELADRKIKETLSLENGAAHIAIEWILNESPRRYAVTAVTLFIENNGVNSYKFVNEYGGEDLNSIEYMPFIIENSDHSIRPAGRGEILDYYQKMARSQMSAKMFDTITDYNHYIEENFKIIPSEWRKIGVINSAEGDVDQYFDGCKTTQQLLNKLLIPVVEEAIAGEVGQDFVKTFEKQREHFKKNKQLLEQIKESQFTREQLKSYIDVYEQLDLVTTEYKAAKNHAKASYIQVQTSLQSKEEQLLFLEEKLKDSEVKERVWRQKKQSLQILISKQTVDGLSKELDHAQSIVHKEKEIVDARSSKKQNIEITKLKEEINSLSEQIQVSERALEQMNQDIELSEMIAKLDENAGFIKGFFDHQINGFQTEKKLVENQSDRFQEEKNEFEKERKRNQDAFQLLGERRIELQTLMARLREEMEQFTAILDNENVSTSVEETFKTWKQALKLQQENQLLLENKIKLERAEKEDLNNEIHELMVKSEAHNKKVVQLQGKLDEAVIKQEKIHQLLAPYIPNLYFNHSLHEKQSSIESILIEKETKLEKAKEKALMEERIKSHLADNYYSAPDFAADPVVLQLVEELAKTVNHIELGSKYYENTYAVQQDSSYPYWAITVITTEADKELVNSKFLARKDQMTHPIIILTVDELRKVIGTKVLALQDVGTTIFPELWTNNLSRDNFEKWKKEIILAASELQKQRIACEKQLAELVAVRRQTNGFFSEMTYADLEALKKELTGSQEEYKQNKEQLKVKRQRVLWLEDNNRVLYEKIRETHDGMMVLEKKLHQAEIYFQKEQEFNTHAIDCKEVERQYTEIKNDGQKLDESICRHSEILTNLKNQFLQLEHEIMRILEKDLYKEVGEAKALFSEQTIKALEQVRKNLLNQINGKTNDREGIVNRIREKTDDLHSKEQELALKEMEAKYPIEEVLNYYGSELHDLIEELKLLSRRLATLQNEFNDKKTSYAVEKSELDRLMRVCLEEYGEILNFEQDIISVQNQLELEKKQQKKEKEDLYHERYELVPRIETLKRLLLDFDISNGKHGFLLPSIDIQETVEPLIIDLNKNMKQVIQDIIFELDQKLGAVLNREEIVEKEKERYKRYCNHQIRDPKLKEMAINVVDKKRSFIELKDSATRLNVRINQSIELAEYNRLTSDQELQIFLEHLHTYVVTIVGELDTIQRKSKIHIDGNLKQIFSFDIPVWDESEGKEELRKHIDWIIEQLDKQGDEAEDEQATTKNLENWLSVKRLLQCILGDQSIKVKCRKVTNDKKISSIPSSWEHSNQWSGGEKWSKNMTLFLSILIYIAEKKQYLSPSDKRSRTVILDNPFGKASSKHVLDPVFFIAERLGFQIIALTAHAEGEFIRNYFPVVYSCKLRASAEVGKQIMTKEKEVHYAYLKEHDPKSLMRFQEVEQVSLFD